MFVQIFINKIKNKSFSQRYCMIHICILYGFAVEIREKNCKTHIQTSVSGKKSSIAEVCLFNDFQHVNVQLLWQCGVGGGLYVIGMCVCVCAYKPPGAKISYV